MSEKWSHAATALSFSSNNPTSSSRVQACSQDAKAKAYPLWIGGNRADAKPGARCYSFSRKSCITGPVDIEAKAGQSELLPCQVWRTSGFFAMIERRFGRTIFWEKAPDEF
jgi:hypothetical protein